MKELKGKARAIAIKKKINASIPFQHIAAEVNVSEEYVAKINEGKLYHAACPWTRTQKDKAARNQVVYRDDRPLRSILQSANVDKWIIEFLLQALVEKETELKRNLAVNQLQLDALQRRDITYLPQFVIDEWQEKGFIKDGKFVEEKIKMASQEELDTLENETSGV